MDNVGTFYLPFGAFTQSSTESNVSVPSSVSGTLGTLEVKLGAAPGSGASYTMTVMQNGTPGAVTCTVSGATATTCTDLVDTVSIVAGDTVSLRVVPSGGPTTPVITWSVDVH